MNFQNHIDGTPTFISPEISMQIQASLGSDIAMLFDECPPYPCEQDYAQKSGELTLRWAERCKEWITGNQPREERSKHFVHVTEFTNNMVIVISVIV